MDEMIVAGPAKPWGVQTNADALLIDPGADVITPPLDLLRHATALRRRGLRPALFRGLPDESVNEPLEAVFTAVYSWDYPRLEMAVQRARDLWPKARLTLSGVLARRMGIQLGRRLGTEMIDGLTELALDAERPDYSLVPDWDASVLITSKGVCPRECSHCDASRVGKGVTRLIPGWPTHIDDRLARVEVWDNTLGLTPRDHFGKVADVLAATEKSVDFVCGIAAGGVEENELRWRIERLRHVRVVPVRLECNVSQDLGPAREEIDRSAVRSGRLRIDRIA